MKSIILDSQKTCYILLLCNIGQSLVIAGSRLKNSE
jgi:hypothetical protein